MQKYKIVASKSQKKYTLVLSADSESHAREKLHKDGYSILSIEEFSGEDISGKKFIFQILKDGENKNWVIVWKDIFKVYIKLRDELWYKVIFLYPEWDIAETDAKKKQDIIQELENGYELQKRQIKIKQEKVQAEESFYMKKQLDETYKLIHSAISKFENIFTNKEEFNVDDETFLKLKTVYEKLIHIKTSTNIVKLKEVWELALIKIGQIELRSLEENKDKESRKLLLETNKLLKKIWSSSHFIEEDKDIKKKVSNFFKNLSKKFSLQELKKDFKNRKEKTELIDVKSYSFLKTLLLLEKYKEKLGDNSKEIRRNIILFFNPFSKSEVKEKILLKRKVIHQNISILKAKKNWGISSYTGIKKWYHKILETFFSTLQFISYIIIFCVTLYFILFFISLTFTHLDILSLYLYIFYYKLLVF